MADASDITLSAAPVWTARIRGALAWTALGVALVALFAVLTFPFDALHSRLINELKRQTGATAQVDVRRSIRPLGIEWIGLRLSHGDRQVATIARATGVLSWVDALQGKPVVQIALWLDEQGGKPAVTARATFADWGFQRLGAIEGLAERVDLQKAAGAPLRGGRAKATFRFEGAEARAGLLEGEVRLEINDLSVEQISRQGIRVPEWGFTSMRATVRCAQQICRIGEFSGTGPDGSVEATGQIVVGHSVEDSRWDVGLTVTCSSSFSQRATAVGGFPLPAGTPLRVKLVGSLLRPQLAL